jgi:hypothetical protein
MALWATTFACPAEEWGCMKMDGTHAVGAKGANGDACMYTDEKHPKELMVTLYRNVTRYNFQL